MAKLPPTARSDDPLRPVALAYNHLLGRYYVVVDVEDAEIHFAVDEYLGHTMSTKPVIYTSPNEIYLTHSLVMQDLDLIVPLRDDPLKALLLEFNLHHTLFLLNLPDRIAA
ncbi:hypothetical protein PtA15_2A619 [Puccinia triticina]|uniref:Uncharacterized protein n=1 Tax=Puccinia triticina TaxID=208348 RepID=A0ABY7CHN2_9BASI|nr:uncharacterized protein PtA15_2A619 [Puccinia triticina]WAQ82302.1 hypothetical protein PtA15_2A619 [Puccinia triticina]